MQRVRARAERKNGAWYPAVQPLGRFGAELTKLLVIFFQIVGNKAIVEAQIVSGRGLVHRCARWRWPEAHVGRH